MLRGMRWSKAVLESVLVVLSPQLHGRAPVGVRVVPVQARGVRGGQLVLILESATAGLGGQVDGVHVGVDVQPVCVDVGRVGLVHRVHNMTYRHVHT